MKIDNDFWEELGDTLYEQKIDKEFIENYNKLKYIYENMESRFEGICCDIEKRYEKLYDKYVIKYDNPLKLLYLKHAGFRKLEFNCDGRVILTFEEHREFSEYSTLILTIDEFLDFSIYEKRIEKQYNDLVYSKQQKEEAAKKKIEAERYQLFLKLKSEYEK